MSMHVKFNSDMSSTCTFQVQFGGLIKKTVALPRSLFPSAKDLATEIDALSSRSDVEGISTLLSASPLEVACITRALEEYVFVLPYSSVTVDEGDIIFTSMKKGPPTATPFVYFSATCCE